MLYDKLHLLDRIQTAINNKWCKAGLPITGLPIAIRPDEEKKAESIQKLKEKISVLEHQYDQLLYVINFLVDHFPNQLMKMVHSVSGMNPAADSNNPQQPVQQFFVGEEVAWKAEPFPTPREKDILVLLKKGLCAKEIACHLYISEVTVNTHKKNLREKFNARNTAELISKAMVHISDNPLV